MPEHVHVLKQYYFFYHKLRRIIAKVHKYFDIISKYNVSFKWHLTHGIFHTSLFGDYLKRVRKLKYLEANVFIKRLNLVTHFYQKDIMLTYFKHMLVGFRFTLA